MTLDNIIPVGVPLELCIEQCAQIGRLVILACGNYIDITE